MYCLKVPMARSVAWSRVLGAAQNPHAHNRAQLQYQTVNLKNRNVYGFWCIWSQWIRQRCFFFRTPHTISRQFPLGAKDALKSVQLFNLDPNFSFWEAYPVLTWSANTNSREIGQRSLFKVSLGYVRKWNESDVRLKNSVYMSVHWSVCNQWVHYACDGSIKFVRHSDGSIRSQSHRQSKSHKAKWKNPLYFSKENCRDYSH